MPRQMYVLTFVCAGCSAGLAYLSCLTVLPSDTGPASLVSTWVPEVYHRIARRSTTSKQPPPHQQHHHHHNNNTTAETLDHLITCDAHTLRISL